MSYKIILVFCLMTVVLSEPDLEQATGDCKNYNKRSTVITSPNGVYIGTGNRLGTGRGRNSNSYDDTGYNGGNGYEGNSRYNPGRGSNYDSGNGYNDGRRGSDYQSGYGYNNGRGSGRYNAYDQTQPSYSVQPASTSGIRIGNRNTVEGKFHAY